MEWPSCVNTTFLVFNFGKVGKEKEKKDDFDVATNLNYDVASFLSLIELIFKVVGRPMVSCKTHLRLAKTFQDQFEIELE